MGSLMTGRMKPGNINKASLAPSIVRDAAVLLPVQGRPLQPDGQTYYVTRCSWTPPIEHKASLTPSDCGILLQFSRCRAAHPLPPDSQTACVTWCSWKAPVEQWLPGTSRSLAIFRGRPGYLPRFLIDLQRLSPCQTHGEGHSKDAWRTH